MVKKAAVTKEYTHVTHPFPALYNKESEILILGSLPSVKSREQMFFYGHPQNRFWKVIAAVLNETVPKNIEEKKAMLYRHHVALWDTIYSCDIIGSSDSSIKNVVPTDLKAIVKNVHIRFSHFISYDYVGALAGYISYNTQIHNCSNEGTIEAERNFSGGLVGIYRRTGNSA